MDCSIVRSLRVTSPPTPIIRVAEYLGLSVLSTYFPPRLGGVLDSRTIYLNSSEPAVRQRFALANLIFHSFTSNSANYFRGPVCMSKDSDVFAANLLVPRHLLKPLAEICFAWELAEIFAVSAEVIECVLRKTVAINTCIW